MSAQLGEPPRNRSRTPPTSDPEGHEREGCIVVWLDDLRYFLEDMRLVKPLQMEMYSVKKRLYDYSSALEWLLKVASAKNNGAFGGFQEKTTGEENVQLDVGIGLFARTAPLVGYMQPPAVAILPPTTKLEDLAPLTELRFHCGGKISILKVPVAPPALQNFILDGSAGWSKSCKHSGGCNCPQTPVSPWWKWGREVWNVFNQQLHDAWRMLDLNGNKTAVHHVTVVVFRREEKGMSVLKIMRDPETGGHFSGWSVPGGNVARGKDADLWSAAIREWNEEMVGYPWEDVVGEPSGEMRCEIVAGCHVYRWGEWSLCVSNVGEQFITDRRIGDGGTLMSVGMSARSTATIYAEVSSAFCDKTDGRRLQLKAPSKCVVPLWYGKKGAKGSKSAKGKGSKKGSKCQTWGKAIFEQSDTHDVEFSTDVRKVHTDGWPYLEHVGGEAKWVPWDTVDEDDSHGANIFPTKLCRASVLPILQDLYRWDSPI